MPTFMVIASHSPENCDWFNEKSQKTTLKFMGKLDELLKKHGVKMVGAWTQQNTMKYIHTIQFKDEDYEIATAATEEEIKKLGQAGFQKYDEMNGIHFYRKPKKFGV